MEKKQTNLPPKSMFVLSFIQGLAMQDNMVPESVSVLILWLVLKGWHTLWTS